QAWADDVAARKRFGSSDPSNPAFRTGGENLYLSYVTRGLLPPPPAQCASAVKAWYDQISDYDYANPGFNDTTKSFTQVVWQNSIQVGCGSSSYENTVRISVTFCQYTPAGNVIGQVADQVKPLA
ncbi:unnamed protein product, partial [Owenia fusiformis]